MQDLIILVQVILPFLIGGIAISIISVLIVNYLSKEAEQNENMGND